MYIFARSVCLYRGFTVRGSTNDDYECYCANDIVVRVVGIAEVVIAIRVGVVGSREGVG
jgi:hypothetical protein